VACPECGAKRGHVSGCAKASATSKRNSQKDKGIMRGSKKDRTCWVCKGSGMDGKRTCRACKGSGEI